MEPDAEVTFEFFRPLLLASPRWATLKAHFGNAATDGDEVPAVTTLIKRWNDSVGTYAEEYEYELLNESFLTKKPSSM